MDTKEDAGRQYTQRCTPFIAGFGQGEEVFGTFFERTCDAVMMVDPSSHVITAANQAALVMMGVSSVEQLCGKVLPRLALEEVSEIEAATTLFREMVEKTGSQGSQRFEWETRRWDGTKLLLEIVMTALDAGSGLVLVVICRDLTEKRRTLQALRDSETMHRALFEATRQGVTLHDETSFFSANPAAVRILRLTSAEQIIGRHPSEISSLYQSNGRLSADEARQHIADCLRDGSKRFEWLTRAADGDEFLLDVQLTAIQVGDRKIIQAVLDDISERKAAEAELLRALETEKSIGRLRSNFVSMVSHEFRTPLSIIQSSAEILQNYLERMSTEERSEHLASIQKNTHRMASLMEEVLFIGRLEAGRTKFVPAPLALDQFLTRIVEEVSEATGRRCPIELQMPPELPPSFGDERLLQPILTNLLTNAVKYSIECVKVRLGIERMGHEACFRVSDTGIGIPESDRDWLFHPFHRGSNVGNRAGTGLGLTIVQRCVDLHHGRMDLQSHLGEGTTFSVWLPMFQAAPLLS